MTFRWRKYLPGYPAFLLVPVLLVLWVAICSLPQMQSHEDSWGYPLVFLGWKQVSPYMYAYYGFQIIPFVFDLVFALAMALLIALAVERQVLHRFPISPRTMKRDGAVLAVRRAGMRLRGPKYLPGWPAILLVPVILGVWVTLCMIPEGTPRDMRGFPVTFLGGWEPDGFGGYRQVGFRVIRFLIDLTLALGTAYILAMTVDRLILPLVRRQSTKRIG